MSPIICFSGKGYHCTDTFGKVPRFRCRTCRKGFSTQTFRINYWAKKLIDYPAGDLSTHGEHAGIPKLPLEKFRGVAYRCRAFLSRFDLTLCDTEAWLKQMPTPLKTGPEYLPRFALG